MENLLRICEHLPPKPFQWFNDEDFQKHKEPISGCDALHKALLFKPSQMSEGLTCQAHHRIRYYYPALDILLPGETCVLPPPYRHSMRRDPSEGVGPAVSQHYSIFASGTGDIAAEHLENLNPCPTCKCLPSIALPPSPRCEHDDLASVISRTVPYKGSTILRIVTYQNCKGKRRVRIRKSTVLDKDFLNLPDETCDYSMANWNLFFRPSQGLEEPPQWLNTIAAFMLRAHATAFLEVRNYIQRQVHENPAYNHVVKELEPFSWMDDAAEEPYDDLTGVLAPVSVLSKDRADRRCAICLIRFKAECMTSITDGSASSNGDDTSEAPVALPCGHIYGEVCVREAYKQELHGSADDDTYPRCPTCRADIVGYRIPLGQHPIWIPKFHYLRANYLRQNLQDGRANWAQLDETCGGTDDFLDGGFDNCYHQQTPFSLPNQEDRRFLVNSTILVAHFENLAKVMTQLRSAESNSVEAMIALWIKHYSDRDMFPSVEQITQQYNRLEEARPFFYETVPGGRNFWRVPEGQLAVECIRAQIPRLNKLMLHPSCMFNIIKRNVMLHWWRFSQYPVRTDVRGVMRNEVGDQWLSWLKDQRPDEDNHVVMHDMFDTMIDGPYKIVEAEAGLDAWVDQLVVELVEFARRLALHGTGYLPVVWEG